MSNPAWTPRTVADGILRLAAGLMILGALGLGALHVYGEVQRSKYRAVRDATSHTFRLDQMTPPGFEPIKPVDRIEAVIPYQPSR